MIRFAENKDIPEIMPLIERLAVSPGYTDKTYNKDFCMGFLYTALTNSYIDMLVAEQDGKVVGVACAAVVYHPLCPDLIFAEQFLVSDNPMFTRGLVRFMLDCASERGCKTMQIGVSTARNPRYVDFLKKLGFHDFGVTLERSV